jgi:hypothetical protein
MAIAALMSKKINRPVMHRITRTDEYGIGAARPGFQGYIKMGFAASGKLLAADMYLVQESGPHATAGDFRAAGNALTMMYQPDACKFRSVPVLTNTVPMGAHRGPGENQFAALVEPMFDKAADRRINAPDQAPVGKTRPVDYQRVPEGGAENPALKWNDRRSRASRQQSDRHRHRARLSFGRNQHRRPVGSRGRQLHIHTGIGNLGTYSRDVPRCRRRRPDGDNAIERATTRACVQLAAGQLTSPVAPRRPLDMKDKLTDIAAKMLGGARRLYPGQGKSGPSRRGKSSPTSRRPESDGLGGK